MDAILDIIIVLIAFLTIYFAFRNGFVKTLLSASSFFIAIVITVLLLSPVKTAFMDTSLAEGVRDRIETEIDSILVKNGFEDVEELIQPDTEANEFLNILDKVGIEKDQLQTEFNEWKTDAGVDLKEKLIDFIAEPVVNAIVTVAAIVLLFFGSMILLKIVAYVLDKICKLPVLKTANKLLGLLLGILLALVRIYLFCIIVKLLLPYGQALDIEVLTKINPGNTLLFKLFYDINIFNLLF